MLRNVTMSCVPREHASVAFFTLPRLCPGADSTSALTDASPSAAAIASGRPAKRAMHCEGAVAAVAELAQAARSGWRPLVPRAAMRLGRPFMSCAAMSLGLPSESMPPVRCCRHWLRW